MAGPTGTARLRAFVSRNSGRDRRARRLLGIGQATVLLAGLLLPTLIAGPVAANTRPATATLTVTKACVPTNDPGRFNLRIDGTTVLANAACGSSKTVTVTAGRHGVSETSGSGTNLSNYTATFGATCPGGWISLTANQSATCTITNTRKPPPATATLTVAKACLPTTDPGRFNLVVDGKTALAGAACGSSAQVTVTTGRHTVSETSGGGTNLFSYAAAIGGACDPTGSITLAANQSATCTITNTRLPSLTVTKVCVPDPNPGQFDILVDGIDHGDVACTAGGNRTVRPFVLSVGQHTVTEAADGTTSLANYVSSYSCPNTGSGAGAGKVGVITLAAGQNATCTITNTVRTPALSVAKTDNGPWTIGQTGAAYTITVDNTGSAATSGTITVTDTLPSGLTLSAAPSGTGWSCPGAAVGGTSISCTSTTAIAVPGSGNAITIPVSLGPTTPTGTNAITNTAAAYGGGDPVHSSSGTAATGSDGTTVGPQASLTITKTDGITSVVPGSQDTYTIVVRNNGPSDALNVAVADTLASQGLDNITSPDLPATVTFNSVTDTWTVGTLAAGASDTLTLSGTVPAGATGSYSNTATATASDATTVTASDADTLTPQASLSLTKLVDGQTSENASVGQTVVFTLKVANAGPSDATGVIVNDLLPAGLTFVSDIVPAGTSYNPVTGIWSVGTLPAEGTATLLITASVGTIGSTVPSSITNTATASADDAATVSASVVVDIPQADLSITKVDSAGGSSITNAAGSAISGTALTYTIVVTNNGPSAVTGATVSDLLPAGIGSDAWTAVGSGGASATVASGFTGNISDTVNLPSGTSVIFTVTGTINASATGTLTNTATVNPPAGVTDTNSVNSATDTDTLTPRADLSITKVDNQGGSSITPSTGSFVPGGSLTYTITVSNAGPSTATGVGVSDVVPTGITSFVWSGNGQTNVSGAISDTIASLAPGASVTYTVTEGIDPAASGTLSNTATASASDATTVSATDSDTIDPGPIAVADKYGITGVNGGCSDGCVLTDTVATNDTPSPVGGNVWSIVPGEGPQVGTVVMNPDGSFTYSTALAALEVDSFTYQIEDADGLVSTAVVTILIPGPK